MNLLLIEDDIRVSEYLLKTLQREGYRVNHLSFVDEVESFLASEEEAPRMIILDRMLGRFDGASLIPKLKSKYPEAAVLVLSALDQASEKARVLDSGADDYLSKPFSLEELTARLRLICRRGAKPISSSSIRCGDIVADLRLQMVSMENGKRLDLTRKEFQLLLLLSETPGRVFNRYQILDRIWEIDHLNESNVVETTIKNIRRKLADAQSTVKIESRRHVGYWIET